MLEERVAAGRDGRRQQPSDERLVPSVRDHRNGLHHRRQLRRRRPRGQRQHVEPAAAHGGVQQQVLDAHRAVGEAPRQHAVLGHREHGAVIAHAQHLGRGVGQHLVHRMEAQHEAGAADAGLVQGLECADRAGALARERGQREVHAEEAHAGGALHPEPAGRRVARQRGHPGHEILELVVEVGLGGVEGGVGHRRQLQRDG